MRGAILISVAALFCGLARVSEATTCKPATGETCKKSTSMTGTCTTAVCVCEAKYTAGPFGCQKKQKAAITASVEFNEFVEKDATKPVLTCSEGLGTNTYKWFKDGNAVAGETGQTLEIETSAVTPKAEYTCQSNIAGIESDTSDAFDVNVVATAPVTSKPKVTGMPSDMVEGTKITFTCESTAIYKTPVYEWKLDGNVVGTAAKTYVHTLAKANDAEKPLMCSAAAGAESDPVPFPAAAKFVADINGVEIQPAGPVNVLVGETVTLDCKQTGGFPEPDSSDTVIKYAWNKDATPTGTVTRTLTITNAAVTNNGKYTCTATAGSNPVKTSPEVTVSVKNTMSKKPIMASATGLLLKGYFSLTCDIENKSNLPVSYKWTFKGNDLPGVTDKVLQFNEAPADFDGAYTCQATGADGTVVSDAYTVALKASTDITQDKTVKIETAGNMGIGEEITLTCSDVKFNTPGVKYEWTVDTTKQSEDSETFKYTLPSKAVTIKCAYTFDGQTSGEAILPITPKMILAVGIKVNNAVVTAVKPVHGTKVNMECDVSKAKGATGTVTYKWTGGPSTGDTAQNYEVTAATTGSTPVTITCAATINSETMTATVTLTPQAKPEAPVLTVDPKSPVTIGEKVVMSCDSASYANGATFEWSKDNTVIKGVTSVKYTIDKVAKSHDGAYTCKMKILATTSDASNSLTLKAIAAGKTCKTKADCNEANMDKTVCTDGRCSCLPSFNWNGKQCSGAAAVMGSLLMIVCVIFAHRIF